MTKKILAGALCVAMALPSMNVSAGTVQKSNPVKFKKAWERYALGDNGKAGLTYGYNTFAINEDYAWAKHDTKSHYAALKNGNGFHTGSGKKAGSTSKIEVRHKGNSVSYYCYY